MAFGVVGMLGMIPFYCSGKTIYTFNDLHRSNSMRFARHEVIIDGNLIAGECECQKYSTGSLVANEGECQTS